MSFASFEFYIFFVVIAFLYLRLPLKWRWCCLLLGGCCFYYTWNKTYLLLIFFSTLITYGCALLIEHRAEKNRKQIVLATGLCINFGTLFVLKYFNFFNEAFRFACNWLDIVYLVPNLKLQLPVGISFYTFYLCGYLLDVFRSTVRAEKHLGIFCASTVFFPLLLAGPIERSKNFLPQFKEYHALELERWRQGLLLIMLGLFKKLVVADRLKPAIDQVFSSTAEYSGMTLLSVVVFNAYQIYCDFSGYCDIAMGTALILGFRITANFNRPFAARSVSDFWRRWHISLSSWMRDYVYYPLVLNSKFKGNTGIITACLLTFGLVGLWHGANWTYIMVGLLQGIAIASEVLTSRVRKTIQRKISANIYNTVCLLITFLFVCLSFIFFKAENLGDAVCIIRSLFKGMHSERNTFPLNPFDLTIVLSAIMGMEIMQIVDQRIKVYDLIARQPIAIRWLLYYSIFFAIIMFGIFSNPKFIYFQF